MEVSFLCSLEFILILMWHYKSVSEIYPFIISMIYVLSNKVKSKVLNKDSYNFLQSSTSFIKLIKITERKRFKLICHLTCNSIFTFDHLNILISQIVIYDMFTWKIQFVFVRVIELIPYSNWLYFEHQLNLWSWNNM